MNMVSRFTFAGVLLAGLALPVSAQVVVATGGVLRVLDRLTGAVTDYDLERLDECRYPADSPLSDAFAHVTILDSGVIDPIFHGWMMASSPALSALDHPRYDVWVLRCDVPLQDSTKSTSGSGG